MLSRENDDGRRCSVIQGDCHVLMRAMPASSIGLVVTDPPYGIDYRDGAGRRIANDHSPQIWWLDQAYRVLKLGAAIACFCRWDVEQAFASALKWAGFTLRSQVVWDKQIHGKGDLRRTFAPQHELILFATKGARFSFKAGRPKSIMRFRRPGRERVHPTEKPVPLLRELVRRLSTNDLPVLDPFCGSGSTGEACGLEGKRFVGIEIDKEYARIARRRIARATPRTRKDKMRGGKERRHAEK